MNKKIAYIGICVLAIKIFGMQWSMQNKKNELTEPHPYWLPKKEYYQILEKNEPFRRSLIMQYETQGVLTDIEEKELQMLYKEQLEYITRAIANKESFMQLAKFATVQEHEAAQKELQHLKKEEKTLEEKIALYHKD